MNNQLQHKIPLNNITPKTLKQLTRDKIQIDNKALIKEIAKKMLNLYYFNPRLAVQYEINFDSHNINQINSKITIFRQNII